MITNPITMEGGAQQVQMLERRSAPSGLPRAPGQVGGDKIASEDVSGFGFSDQLSKGSGGRVVTPEWQEKIGLSHGIQVADQAMEEIDQELQQAKDDLTEIHKMFPPYPHGSEERAELLNSYKSLRLQIDQLTIPRDSDSAAKILGNPSEVESGSLPEVGSFPVHSGEGGLALVELKGPVEELEDSELPALIEDLERATGVLKERREGLEASAGKLFNQETGEDAEFVKLSREVQEQLAFGDHSMGRPKTGVHQDLPFLD